jgi:phage terminase small subunit
MLTHRESKYVNARIAGKSKQQSLLIAGFSPSLAAVPFRVVTPEMETAVAEITAELVAQTIEQGLVDATEIHQYLTDAIRADMRDIRNEDGSFKPQSEWPAIWGQMMEAGDVEVEYEQLTERSHDDATEEKRGGWDVVGEKVVKHVKVKFCSRAKLLELAMKHKGVNAMVEPKQGDINITVITAEQARKVIDARKRLAKQLPSETEE